MWPAVMWQMCEMFTETHIYTAAAVIQLFQLWRSGINLQLLSDIPPAAGLDEVNQSPVGIHDKLIHHVVLSWWSTDACSWSLKLHGLINRPRLQWLVQCWILLYWILNISTLNNNWNRQLLCFILRKWSVVGMIISFWQWKLTHYGLEKPQDTKRETLFESMIKPLTSNSSVLCLLVNQFGQMCQRHKLLRLRRLRG